MADRQREMVALMRDVLGDDYVSLEVRSHTHEEDLAEGTSTVRATLVDRRAGVDREIQGSGTGLVDAFFNALLANLVGQYQSLRHIRFQSFSVGAQAATGRRDSLTDAVGTVRLEVDNQVGSTFVFTDSSRSVTASSIRVTVAAVEYFVNSELAFFRVREFLDNAHAEGRSDTAERYTHMLTRLVRNASYAVPKDGDGDGT